MASFKERKKSYGRLAICDGIFSVDSIRVYSSCTSSHPACTALIKLYMIVRMGGGREQDEVAANK